MSQGKDNSDFFVNLDWTKSAEDLLVEWGDHAACFSYVYDKSYRKFDRTNTRLSIPIISLSTIIGTLSIGINSIVPEDYVDVGQKVIGSINLLIAIVTTIQNHFRYAQLSEMHLNQCNEWSKLERNIKIELSIEKENRKPAADFVRLCRYEYEKLLNSNPIIPEDIIDAFRIECKKYNLEVPIVLSNMKKTKTFEDKFKSSEPRPITPPSYIQRLKSIIPGTKSFREAKSYPMSPKSSSQSFGFQVNKTEIEKRSENIPNSRTPSDEEKDRLERLNLIRKSLIKTQNIVIDEDDQYEFKTEVVKSEDEDEFKIHISS